MSVLPKGERVDGGHLGTWVAEASRTLNNVRGLRPIDEKQLQKWRDEQLPHVAEASEERLRAERTDSGMVALRRTGAWVATMREERPDHEPAAVRQAMRETQLNKAGSAALVDAWRVERTPDAELRVLAERAARNGRLDVLELARVEAGARLQKTLADGASPDALPGLVPDLLAVSEVAESIELPEAAVEWLERADELERLHFRLEGEVRAYARQPWSMLESDVQNLSPEDYRKAREAGLAGVVRDPREGHPVTGMVAHQGDERLRRSDLGTAVLDASGGDAAGDGAGASA